MSRCYHYKRRILNHRHCSSHRSRTGCRTQRPSRSIRGGGGCGKRKNNFKWKRSGSTARKSGRFYRHNKPSTVFGSHHHTSRPLDGTTHFLQACARSKPYEFHFFDTLDNMDDITFTDCVTSLSTDTFHSCYDYCNDDIFFNRYQDTCMDTYYECLSYSPADIPTSLSDAIKIDKRLGNTNWKDAYNIALTSFLDSGQLLSANCLPQFKFKHNRTHKVHFVVALEGPVVPIKSTIIDDQGIPYCASHCHVIQSIFTDDQATLNQHDPPLSSEASIFSFSPSSEIVDEFLTSFDILAQSRIISSLLPSVTVSTSYRQLSSSELQYKVILLEAHRLRLNLSNYDDRVHMPLQNPAIYHSNKPDELPIVIDTGASCSITPMHSDFIGTIDPSDVSTLNNISGTTAVVGQGTIEWNIQDAKGVVKPIQTTAYYIPQATIRLFSPQVYIKQDKSGTSEMTLKKHGVHLILTCGTPPFLSN
jgi:hypothetical protein